MAQFDVHRIRGGGLVIDCQSTLLNALPTRFVVPLRARDGSVMTRLNPLFVVDGAEYAMTTQLAGAIALRDLGAIVCSLSAEQDGIKAALDVLTLGV